ncbi:hypothetical protein HME9304_02516 [Flagellimonas maritima]|uniref:Uncharacterized protein n=1 Tax=Flagellimonas maritima TaxID=1383885 RepID=A0A2Z4LVY9_9FLAO|nr:hypothetical protein [Allomuricauda aurantiaca]AWX45497.1 hypothetical protein HME9304_02516 [Allomuricauda aurantiaca]
MSKKTIYNELLKEEKELQDTLDKVRGLIRHYAEAYGFDDKPQKKIEFREPEHNSVAIKEGYDIEWAYWEKTMYLLKEHKKLTSSELSDLLYKHENGKIDEDRAGKIARSQLSDLYKRDKIGASLVGKGNKRRYYLKENAPK